MKIRNEKSIAIVYDAVSISKGLDVVSGSVKQNYYAESATYVPDRFIFPLVLQPRIEVSDPNKVIPNGDKVSELARLEWFVDDVKIKSNNDYAIEGTTLKVFRNSEEPFVISYRAEWLDPRKNQVIVIEDSLAVSCISLAQNDADATMSLSKPQNWIHNPLKGERVYTINAYVSKGKVYESAVEWYYVNKEGKDVLIDESCSFYVDGQYTNALDVDSSYMDNVVIKAKNISDDKLKEVYWFFDKHGKPISYASPDKTELKGANVFSLPSSPTAAKLDYRIEGLTIEQLVKNGDFSEGIKGWVSNISTSEVIDNVIINTPDSLIDSTAVGIYQMTDYNKGDILYLKALVRCSKDTRIRIGAHINEENIYLESNNFFKNISSNVYIEDDTKKTYKIYYSTSSSWDSSDRFYCKNFMAINLTQTFGAGNEPSKEWCDEHIQNYFEGIKSVTTPLRVKSVGENLITNGNGEFGLNGWLPHLGATELKVLDNGGFSYKRTSSGQRDGIKTLIYLPKGEYWIRAVGLGQTSYSSQIYMLYHVDSGFKKEILRTDHTSSRVARFNINLGGYYFLANENIGNGNSIQSFGEVSITAYRSDKYVRSVKPSDIYISLCSKLRSVGSVKDYVENGTLYKNISDDGEVLSQPEIINLNTSGTLTSYPNGTIFIEPATLVEQQYSDGITVNLPIKEIESIKVGTDSLDISKAVVKDNLITHPDIDNGDFVTLEYIYDDNPIYGDNSISYLSLEEILDDLWLDNVYTYKLTEGKWELVKVTEISDYEEWLKTDKTSPYTLAPDGVVFGKYEAETKFIRQYPSSLYVDFIAPTRLKEGVSQIKARALVGTRDGVLENPSKYFDIKWYKRSVGAGQVDEVIGYGDEITIDIRDKDMIGIEIESIKIKKNGKKNQ